jgi:hypothetical protein
MGSPHPVCGLNSVAALTTHSRRNVTSVPPQNVCRGPSGIPIKLALMRSRGWPGVDNVSVVSTTHAALWPCAASLVLICRAHRKHQGCVDPGWVCRTARGGLVSRDRSAPAAALGAAARRGPPPARLGRATADSWHLWPAYGLSRSGRSLVCSHSKRAVLQLRARAALEPNPLGGAGGLLSVM